MGKKIDSYSIDYSANYLFNTTTNAKCDQTWYQTDGKDHPDYGIPLHIPQNEPILITPDAVFIKSLNLVMMTEDNYNKLKENENGNIKDK